jgi:hypothetical protein
MDLFQQCHTQSVEFFSELFRESLEQLPELFSEKMAAAQTDMQGNRYLEARKVIQPMLKPIASHYRKVLDGGFRDFSAGCESEDQARSNPAQLALVEKAQFEDDVAIRSIANKSSVANSEELWKLNRRFAVIRGGKKCCNENNPCGALRLCVAMRDAYGLVELDPTIKLHLYKMYEQKILSRAGEHYALLNRQLAGQGVLKTLSFAVANRAEARAAGGSAAPLSQPPADGAQAHAANDASALVSVPTGNQQESVAAQLVSPEVERRQARVMEAIQTVQQRRRQSDQPRNRTIGGASYGVLATDGVAGQGDTFSQRELSIALGVLQAALQLPAARQAQPCRVSDTEKKLMGELGNLAEQHRRHKVTSVDADTIDLVGMLFDYMLDDQQLPDGLKSLLSHLHTPYLKVALIDKQFFASARHPARCLLDLMAAAGARWACDGEDDEKVYQRIRMTVERIITDFDDDLVFFDELLKEFANFVKVLERRADLAAQRSAEAEKGLDQLQQARDAAAGEIAQRMAGSRLPGAVVELLQQPWTDFLVFNYLRHGSASQSWLAGLEVVDGIISTACPREGAAASQYLQQPAKLITEIESGLASLGYDRDKGQRLIQAMQQAQQVSRALATADVMPAAEPGKRLTKEHGAPPVPATQGLEEVSDQKSGVSQAEPKVLTPPSNVKAGLAASPLPDVTVATGSAISRQMGQQQSSPPPLQQPEVKALSFHERRLADKLASVNFGTWFEFKDGFVGATAARLKLCWYSSVSGNYMFVNHSGVKTAVMTLPDLVKGMHEGAVSILERENKKFFERALASVLGHLSRA